MMDHGDDHPEWARPEEKHPLAFFMAMTLAAFAFYVAAVLVLFLWRI